MKIGWRERAACLGKAPLWDQTIDDGGDGSETPKARNQRRAEAKAICAECTVRDECWADAKPGRDEGTRDGRDLRPVNDHHQSRKKWAS